MSTHIPKELRDCLENISEELDADLLLYSTDIDDQKADKLIDTVRKKLSRRKNVVLILATYGGDPDAAYRITRFLKQAYSKFTLFVFGYCKSAGTLIALGADEIVMSDLAELGPLDIQVLKEDDFRRSSGLDLQQSLSVLNEEMYKAFENYFLSTVYKSGGAVSTKMAADIASAMAVGLLAPVAGQIDPLRLGELSRSMEVAYEYGIRLNPNLDNSIKRLVSGYPSHSFVIDREEAQVLFSNVREPTEQEFLLEAVLNQCVRYPTSEQIILFLTDLVSEDDNIQEGEESEQFTNEISTKKKSCQHTKIGEKIPEREYQRNSEENSRIEQDRKIET